MDSETPALPNFPTALCKGRSAPWAVSRLWILTLLSAGVAGGLVYWQWAGSGPQIEVHFAEGHGLAGGDPLRYRGITVGEVREIVLDSSEAGVVVRIQLTAAAGDLARAGARFWIERPNIGIGKLQGLGTIVGGRFIGVLPGPRDAPRTDQFVGLEVASVPIPNRTEGLEVILESRDRYGLQVGSPIHYRGVAVGQILSVGLTQDAATVEARAYIEAEYRPLVRAQTQFWSSSGLGVKIGLSGIELDADTLATIAAGGVAFATPTVPGPAAVTGQRFELHKSPRDAWLAWQPRVTIGSAALAPGAMLPRPVLGIRSQAGPLGVLGAGRQRGWLLPTSDGRLLGPVELLSGEPEAGLRLEVAGQQTDLPLDELRQGPRLASGRLPQPLEGVPWPLEKLRCPQQVEAILLSCGTEATTFPVAVYRLTAEERGWVVDAALPLDSSWQGACAVAASDGQIVGMLLREEERWLVVPLTPALLATE